MIKENILEILENISNEISLIAVSKKHSIDKIKEAIDSGVKIIAENRIQESIEKYDVLKDYFKKGEISFHFIGHLQSNKVKKAVEIFDMIQTVDSVNIAQEIDKRASYIDKIQDILIQVNIGREEQKYGLLPEKVVEVINEIKDLKNIKIKGFMCMAPYFKDSEDARPYFKDMKKIYDKYNYEILSMGMTNDYKVAIQEGSNMIRIGTGIFGERIK